MKLKHTAFANSIAVLSIIFYVLLYATYFIFPNMYFKLIQSYFLAPAIAGLLPPIDFARSMIGGILIVGVLSWLFGYAWALFYNYFAKAKVIHKIRHHIHHRVATS